MPTPFDQLAKTPAEHFRLYIYAAVQHLLQQVGQSFGSVQDAVGHFPFLAGYRDELSAYGLDTSADITVLDWWSATLDAWESHTATHLPLRSLRQATDLDQVAVVMLLTVGLIEEDARFGLLFETMQGALGEHRVTVGLLTAWFRDVTDDDTRVTLRRWRELGLLEVLNPESPRLEWSLQIPAPIWDVCNSEPTRHPMPGLSYRRLDELVPFPELLLSPDTRRLTARLPDMLSAGEAQTVIVRGPRHNGRRTLLGALARQMQRGVLEFEGAPTDDRWRWIGPLATLMNAVPVVDLDPAPGETLHLRPLTAYRGPLGVALGRQGGVTGADLERAVVLNVPMPDPDLRRRHWAVTLDDYPAPDLDAISDGFRLTGGNIRRAATLARVQAQVEGRQSLSPADVQFASRTLNRQVLDTIAEQVSGEGNWSHFAGSDHTWRELHNLETRCRQREHLRLSVGQAFGERLNVGVRAMFTGPSGTGKSLAARLLAGSLGRDLYRLDLSAVVNKYIGETEKNLDRAFSRAEELDVILLIDEGDALLTSRTTVQSSNDRYANLETNFLLQRLESFEGIVIVTTNASEHVDAAFQRRMDVVITFTPPEAVERWTIWQMHLPTQHAIDGGYLEEVARRCELRGGQIRNAVLHATLLALDDGGTVTSDHLTSAVQREYRKISAVCPLRRAAAS